MKKIIFSFLLIFIFQNHSNLAFAQDGNDIFAADDDDLNIGGDIFTDFNEEMENSKVIEDERFYRFGRFFTFNVGLGFTWFDGNRGIAYDNPPPSYALGFTFFKDFQSALNLGLEFSKHTMFLAGPTMAYPTAKVPGLIEVNMLRVHFSYRHYIDTTNLGTAITYSNPYFTGRMEYWYQTLKFRDQKNFDNKSGGGLGLGLGFGLEFPIEVRESYWGIESLIHTVNYFDKDSNDYQPNPATGPGYDNLNGNAYSTMIYYIFNW